MSPAEQGRVPGASLGAKAPAGGSQTPSRSLVPGQLSSSPRKGEGHPTRAGLVIRAPWGRGVPVLTGDKGVGHLPPGAPPTAAPGAMAGERGAWGRDSQGAARHARPAPRLGSFAHGLSPLPRAASSLNSFGLDDERECAHVRACVCVGVPRRVSGFSPRLVTSSVHSPRAAACGRGRPRALLTLPMAAQGGREGGEDGRGGGHRVTREMLPLQIVISHRSGSPAKGRAPGSPVLSRAMQIVGARRRLSQWGAGGGVLKGSPAR